MNFKLGMVITQINSIIQKRFVAIATCLDEIKFLCKGSIGGELNYAALSICNEINHGTFAIIIIIQ